MSLVEGIVSWVNVVLKRNAVVCLMLVTLQC